MNMLRKEWVFTIGAFLLISASSLILQPRFSFMGGHVWEQGTYLDLASGFTHGICPIGPAPAVFRFGVPWLVSLLPFSSLHFSLTDGFLVVNLFANSLTIVLLVLWLRFFVDSWRVRAVLILFYMLHWLAPTRFSIYMPLNVDAWGMLFLVAGLYLTERYRKERRLVQLLLVLLISVLGIAVRETVLIVPITFAMAFICENRSDSAKQTGKVRFDFTALFPLAFALVATTFLRAEVTAVGNYHFMGAALNWAYAKPLPTYLLGWFLAFGPAIILLLHDGKPTLDFLRKHLWLAFYFLIFVLLAYIGGSDTERILQWSSPVVLVLLGRWIERNRSLFQVRWFFGLLIALQLIAERVFFSTPDLTNEQLTAPIFLTSLSNKAYYMNLFSYHAPREISALLLAEYLLISLLLLIVVNRLKKAKTALR